MDEDRKWLELIARHDIKHPKVVPFCYWCGTAKTIKESDYKEGDFA